MSADFFDDTGAVLVNFQSVAYPIPPFRFMVMVDGREADCSPKLVHDTKERVSKRRPAATATAAFARGSFDLWDGTHVWERHRKILPGRDFTLECLVVRNEGGWMVGNERARGEHRGHDARARGDDN